MYVLSETCMSHCDAARFRLTAVGGSRWPSGLGSPLLCVKGDQDPFLGSGHSSCGAG